MTSNRPLQIGLGCANFLSASLPELIDIAARHGFPSVTIRPLAFMQAIEGGLTEKALRRRFADAGLRATLVDALTSALPGIPSIDTMDPTARATAPPDILSPPNEEDCFHCAEALGLPVVNVVHYRGTPIPLQQMADAVGALSLRAKKRGLRLMLEFVPETGIPTLPSAQVVVAACGALNCGILLDTFHLDRSGGTADDVRRLPPGIIANIQISDRTPQPPGAVHQPFSGRQLPGEGTIPLREILTAALANSPDATIDIEVLNADLRSLPTDEAAARLSAATTAWTEAFSASRAT